MRKEDVPLRLAWLALALAVAFGLCTYTVAAEQSITRPVQAAAKTRQAEPRRATIQDLITETIEQAPTPIYAGTFTAYAYCSCSICCGKWSAYNLTNSGTTPTEGRTIAADWSVLPAGTHVLIGGQEYVVEDTGSGIKGNTLDIYISGHDRARAFGVQTVDVWVIGPEAEA